MADNTKHTVFAWDALFDWDRWEYSWAAHPIHTIYWSVLIQIPLDNSHKSLIQIPDSQIEFLNWIFFSFLEEKSQGITFWD